MLRTILFFTLAAVTWWPAPTGSADDGRRYELEYRLDLREAPAPARVALTVRQTRGELRRLRFAADSPRFTDFEGEGLQREGDEFVWRVPREGGTLRWRAPITHARGDGELDAKLGKRWALFRGEDAFPAMASVSLKGAQSASRLSIDLRESWSVVTPYARDGADYVITNPARRFDRPTGWLVAGRLGVRYETVAGVRVRVAAPTREGVRRQDMLALLNWTLPEVRRVLPTFPQRLLIVSAGDPFWRGGLSGPASLYIHADRPLISGNGTSTLLHELFHVGFGRAAAPGDDWIVEGLAEYYSVELLRRTGTVTQRRSERTFESLAGWGRKAKGLRGSRAGGAVTARAVGVFAGLDAAIREASGDARSLDDVVNRLAAGSGALDLTELRAAVDAVAPAATPRLARIR